MLPIARQLTLVWLATAMAVLAMPVWAQPPQQAPGGSARPVVRFAQLAASVSEQPQEQVAAPPSDDEPQILQSLPEIPSMPGSLYQPAPPVGPPPPDLEHPYLQRDPLLDPADWAQPGWFVSADIGIIKPHVSIPMMDQVTTGLGAMHVVQLNSAHLNWTAAPRLEVGYRLPSGFGEISLSDRYFNTFGNDTTITPDGPAARHSELMVNYADLDYSSRELTPNVGWGLKFRGGVRFSQTFFGSRVNTPFAAAAAGTGVFLQNESSRSTGVGPHFGVEADRRLGQRWSVVANIDAADQFSWVRNTFFAATTTPTPGGGFDSGTASSHFKQEIPILTTQLGLSWRPARFPRSRFYIGYFGQYWYKFATNSNIGVGPFFTPVETQFNTQGIILQWNFNQ